MNRTNNVLGFLVLSSLCVGALIIAAVVYWTETKAATDIDSLPVRGEWVRTSDSPLSPRSDAIVAWNGTEILVFGGNQFICGGLSLCATPSTAPFSDGAAYDPSTDTWRTITNAPYGLWFSRTASIGTDIFVLDFSIYAQRSLKLLRYNSKSDQWNEFDLPNDSAFVDILAFGNNLLLYSLTDEHGEVADWLLDPDNAEWTQLESNALSPGFGRQFVSYSDSLYLFDHEIVPSPGGESGPSYLRAARYDAGQWRVLPTANSIGSAPALVAGSRLISPELGCADGGETNSYGQCIAYGAVFDTTTSTWGELPNAPGKGTKYVPTSGGLSEDNLILFKAGYPAIDTTTNEWFIVPGLDTSWKIQRAVHAVGTRGFAFGGVSFENQGNGELLKDAWVWTP